jgi:hypothetical protein
LEKIQVAQGVTGDDLVEVKEVLQPGETAKLHENDKVLIGR